MRKIIDITPSQVTPTVESILVAQGLPKDTTPNQATLALAEQAISTYRNLAKPIGLIMSLSADEFQTIYVGQGDNHSQAPLADIYPSSDSLALFAVTIGQNICRAIATMFDNNDYAAAAMLDSAASEATELAANHVEQQFRQHLKQQGLMDSSKTSLQFCPGYCGWHISAQKKLFELLRPEEINIGLSDSYLMKPLKSITGVIVAGKRSLFLFDDNFDFCRDCRTRSCRQRMQLLTDK